MLAGSTHAPHGRNVYIMRAHLVPRLRTAVLTAARVLRQRLCAATRPATAPIITGSLADLARTKPQLLLENALLRQQLIILRRSMQRPLGTWSRWPLSTLLARIKACNSGSPIHRRRWDSQAGRSVPRPCWAVSIIPTAEQPNG